MRWLPTTPTHHQPSETHGDCFGFNLVYSGNFLVECEQTETGRMRVNIGLHPLQFNWPLRPGEAFETPEVVLAFSGEGMGGMSRAFHAFYKAALIPPQWRGLVAPVLVNTWEAMYVGYGGHDTYMPRLALSPRLAPPRLASPCLASLARSPW